MGLAHEKAKGEICGLIGKSVASLSHGHKSHIFISDSQSTFPFPAISFPATATQSETESGRRRTETGDWRHIDKVEK